jgi:hypothetical protein
MVLAGVHSLKLSGRHLVNYGPNIRIHDIFIVLRRSILLSSKKASKDGGESIGHYIAM